MAEFKSIPLDRIYVPERLRAVEEDHALAIQASIVEHGLINPITVRFVPNQAKGRKPYVLIAGAHRLRAVELNDETEIDALVVQADADEAQLIEITENLFRNDLSALDRAMFVISYREVWERKHGKIRRGGDQTVKFTESPLGLMQAEAASGFSVHVADRLGLSVNAIEKAQQIGKSLDPILRQSLRGTAAADNQSALLKLARMDPERQRNVARAFAFDEERNIARAIELTDPDATAKNVLPSQDQLFARLVSTWERADAKTRARFLEHAKAAKPRERLPKLSELMAEVDASASGGASLPTRARSRSSK